MNDNTEQIMIDFEERIENIEKSKKNKTLIFNTVLYTVSIMLFLLVLAGTIFSYNNYQKVKEKVNDANNNVTTVELKI